MDERISYSREEVIAAGSNLPTRGLFCQECGNYIPVFEDLSEEDEQRVRKALQQHSYLAMEELRDATGCSLEWAKLWAHHGGKPTPPKDVKPCPYCDQPLRTPLAKQCRFCGRDWHDEDNVAPLKDQP